MTSPAPSPDQQIHEFLCLLLRDEPRIEHEEARMKIRVDGETYWVISGVDLHALLAARQFVLAAAVPAPLTAGDGNASLGAMIGEAPEGLGAGRAVVSPAPAVSGDRNEDT